jgi:hypothetical protein
MSSKSILLATAVATAISSTVARPEVEANAQAVPALVEAVTREVTPIVENATNSEPWYRSRVTWGAIASIVLPLLGAFGVRSDIIDADQFVALGLALGTAAGGLLTLYGRWKAKRPIGQ